MAKTATKEATPTQDALRQAPPSQPPAAIASPWEQFQDHLSKQADQIAHQLPAHVSKEKFFACAQSAVKQNPDLLRCTLRSLFSAITKSAQDGILPDGREGVITSYRTKIPGKDGAPDKWLPVAQWNPMVYGLRKRARELDKLLIDAQVVYANDKFIWHQGDDPRIEHVPASLGSTRGDMIGAYAIFKREDGTILHREVMPRDVIMDIKAQSKAKESLMWTTFETEGWRKTVVRRGIKTVPVHPALEEIVRREDENFEFMAADAPEGAEVTVMVPPRPKESDFKGPAKAKEAVDVEPEPEGDQAGDGRPEPPPVGEVVAPAAVQAKVEPEMPAFLKREPANLGQKPPASKPEPEPEIEQVNPQFEKARKWLAKAMEAAPNEDDLDAFKKSCRGVIDSFAGISDEEKDVLRGGFMRAILDEQKRRGKGR